MFNNKFNSSKVDPLVEAVKGAMQDGDLRRQAEALVNEEFGVYSRNALVNEKLAAYDARLEEAYANLKEGNKENKEKKKEYEEKAGMKHIKKMGGFPGQSLKRTARELTKEGNDGNLANNYPPYDKVTRGDVVAGRLGKDQMGGKKKHMEEGTAESETSMSVTKNNKPSTPAQTNASTSGPSAAEKSALTAKIKTIKEASMRTSTGTGAITAGKVKKRLVGSEPRHPNPGAIVTPSPMVQPLKEAWKRLKEAKKEMKEARKCMEEDFDSFDYSNINEAFANYIAEAINTYGAINEHPEATVENLHMFNEAYVAAVLAEAEKCEYEKAEMYEKDAKKHKKHMKMAKEMKKGKKAAKKSADKEELDEAKKWIQSAIKHPGALSKKLGVPEEKNIPASKLKVKEGDSPATKKQKVLAKTLKHIARKKAMAEEMQIDELSAFGQAFQAAGGKNFTFNGKSYSGARADGKASTPAASTTAPTPKTNTPGTQGVATGKSFAAIDKATANKAPDTTTPTVSRDTGLTGKPSGETGVTSDRTVSLDRPGNPGAGTTPTSTSKAAPGTFSPSRAAGDDQGQASKNVQKLMSMNESVQVGDNKYRIV